MLFPQTPPDFDKAVIATHEIKSECEFSTGSRSTSSNEPCRHRVHFNEVDNQYHARQEPLDPTLWYTAQDFARFQRETREYAARLQATRDPNSWSNTWMRVYFLFRVANTLEEVNHAIEATKISMDETKLGLEDHFLTPICSDYIMRRQHLLHQLWRLQHQPIQNPSQREALIRQTSILSSHAACMYARFVAQTLYLSED